MQLNYSCLGQGSPVILVHGLFGSMSNLGVLARSLSEGYCVYSVDLRNHGGSGHAEGVAYSDLAEDLVRFMDDREVDRAALVGHSMGGKAGMQVALNWPQRVVALVVGDIAPVRYPNHHDQVLAGLRAVVEAEPTTRREADTLLAGFVSEPPLRAFLLKNLVKTENGVLGLKVNLDAIEAHYADIAAAPSGRPFPGPTLFIKGSNSDYIRSEHRQPIMELFPGAQLKVLDNTAHWLHADKPALFNRTVARFLNALPAW